MHAFEFADDLGFPHAGIAKNEQARHAVARGISEKRVEPIERGLRLIESDPAVRLDPLDALAIRQSRAAPVGRIEVREILAAHDHSSTG